MRVISCHPNYSLQIFEGKDKHETDSKTGQSYTVVERPALNAQFMAGASGAGLYPHELALALSSWDNLFRGKPDEVIGNPAPYISVYDTDAQAALHDWDAEYKGKVEERIRFLSLGRESFFLIVDEIKATKPFPAYDDKTPEEILAYRQWSEGDPELYIAYEEENLNREDLISALRVAHSQAADGEVMAVVTA